TLRPALTYESNAGDLMMSPGEVDFELSKLATDVNARTDNDTASAEHLLKLLAAFRTEWRLLWHAKGSGEEMLSRYRTLIGRLSRDVTASVPDSLKLASNGKSAVEILFADLAAMAKESGQAGRPALHG